MIKECLVCGKEFSFKGCGTTRNNQRKYCSMACWSTKKTGRRVKPRVRMSCKQCGAAFELRWATSTKLFCDNVCSAAYRSGPKHHLWVGRSLTRAGYVWINTPAGHGFEHRIVMAKMLDRPMVTGEQVHHRDGDRQNNNPSNLELRTGNHGAGATKHCPTCTCEEHQRINMVESSPTGVPNVTDVCSQNQTGLIH
jgi:hypothetical protein